MKACSQNLRIMLGAFYHNNESSEEFAVIQTNVSLLRFPTALLQRSWMLLLKISPKVLLFPQTAGEDLKTPSSKKLASNISKLIIDTTSMMQIPEPILRILDVTGDQQNGEISVTEERQDIILIPTCQSSCGEGKYPLVSSH